MVGNFFTMDLGCVKKVPHCCSLPPSSPSYNDCLATVKSNVFNYKWRNRAIVLRSWQIQDQKQLTPPLIFVSLVLCWHLILPILFFSPKPWGRMRQTPPLRDFVHSIPIEVRFPTRVSPTLRCRALHWFAPKLTKCSKTLWKKIYSVVSSKHMESWQRKCLYLAGSSRVSGYISLNLKIQESSRLHSV